MPVSLRLQSALLAALISLAFSASAQDLPPRSEWRTSSSATQAPGLASRFAIDGDPTTKWGGPFSPGHWVQVDFGRAAEIGGVILHWDLAFAVAYLVQTSVDGERWHDAYQSIDSAGTTDYVFFPHVRTRYLRIASMPRTADWGVNIYEIEPVPAGEAPSITGLSGNAEPTAIWRLGSSSEIAARGADSGTRELRIAFGRPYLLAGVEVDWAAARATARLEARDASGAWQQLAFDPEDLGETSFLAAREARSIRELRLIVSEKPGVDPQIERLRLLGPARVMTPMKRYQIAASRAHRELFPRSLHAEQVYWTVVGVPAARQKSIFDEYGHIEPFKGGPLVQAIWRDDSGKAVAAGNVPLTHRLRAGWMPLPAVEWSPHEAVRITSEALGTQGREQPIVLVRHRIANRSAARVEGQLALVVRPIQINPPWQNGGLSPIHEISIESTSAQTAVRVNGRVLVHSLTPVDARGAAAFGEHGETEITREVAAGTVPLDRTARDLDGLAAGVLSYRVTLAPNETRDVVIALPLGNERIDPTATRLADVPSIDRARLMGAARDAGAAFDRLREHAARDWQRRFGSIGLTLPDPSLVNMLRAQAAYMLLNQTGPAMQPGPRNYSRSFIRDGSATAAVLVRMGQAQVARDYLRWYADHAVRANGLVSPILNDDGTNYLGFGSDIEYDAQGQFIWLVAEIARLDGGPATVSDYRSHVTRAMRFMQELRERTLVPGYMADKPLPARFRGILAPSISHEGYSTPTHSYWDNYWALKGWHDGAWLAESWGDRHTAAWAREQYAALRQSMADSIRIVMDWRDADFIPTDADMGNPDPTSVSIALDPTGQKDLLPRDALERTFARYFEDVRKRNAPDALFGYTPYELRNILTYVHLNRPQHANELLSNFLQHRRPFDWQVFAEVVQSRLRYPIYLGDMPHTWIGAEYARALFGMLMREEDDRLLLLPGTPQSWVDGEGLSIRALPTAYGKLTLSARRENQTLIVQLKEGLRSKTRLHVSWPNRQRPKRVTVDGRAVAFDADGATVEKPFRRLVAEW